MLAGVHRVKTGRERRKSCPVRHRDMETDKLESAFVEQPSNSGGGARGR